jgi:FKBP-type peptidyl-prolyl cis-trans isomerase FklB
LFICTLFKITNQKMKNFLTVLMVVFCTTAFAQTKQAAKPIAKTTAPVKPAFKNGIDSFSYALGLSIGTSLKSSGVDKINGEILAKALNQTFSNSKTVMSKEQASTILQQKLQEYNTKKSNAAKQECLSFLAANKKRPGINELPNGLQYEILNPGEANGIKPNATDTVVVDYVGTLINGSEFDNSYKRGAPATFPVGGVIKGWTQILQLMPKGAKWKVYIPSELAYGENPPSPQIPPNSVLIFEINLLDVKVATTIDK